MSRAWGGLVRISGVVFGCALALATSGCVGASLATGPLMSAVQLIADRTVERTVAADLVDAQAATEAVLARMAFRVEHRERNDGIRRLRAVADDVTVYATLERVTAKLTRVGLRVEAGGISADRGTGEQIQARVAELLVPPTSPVAEPAARAALSTLQAEIHQLRSDIGKRRAAEGPLPTRESPTTVHLDPGAVIAVPMSAALPTVGGPAPTVSVPAPATAPAVAESTTSSPEPSRLSFGSARLRPAAALTPVQPATAGETVSGR